MQHTLLLFLTVFILSACSSLNDSNENSSYQDLLPENDGEYAAYSIVNDEDEVRELMSKLSAPEYRHVTNYQTDEVENPDEVYFSELEASGVPEYFIFDNSSLIFKTNDEEEFFSYLDDLSEN
ncbi:hypothetical protein [Alkalicoccus luteus]|uniref:hypothetical protein n=1 Tax=Alkalicoccus luteus TaxID=1237094 RepID=UPI00403383BB